LIETHLDPQAARLDDFDYGLTCHHRAAGVGVAPRHQSINWRHQPQTGALATQAFPLGAQARQFLTCGRQIGLRCGQRRLRDARILTLGFDTVFADIARRPQLLVATRLIFGKGFARADFLNLRFNRQHIGLGTFDGGVLCAEFVIEINRLHLAQ